MEASRLSMQQQQELLKVAVLGGSAGSIDAFTKVLAGLPERPGFAVVVISHLDPTQPSQLDEVLKRHTPMPVERLTHMRKIVHDTVFVLPEGASMTALDGHFRLARRAPGLHLPIDMSLASLAQDADIQAAAVILSGSGSDGAAGIVDLKASGGLVLAQSPASAAHDGMPIAAINTGLVDAVLAIDELAVQLLQRFGNAAAALPDDAYGDALATALALVQERTGTNLGYVKDVNLKRRFLRRVLLQKNRDVAAYLQDLRTDPREAAALRDDILIGVTAFFRDTEFVNVLRVNVIPQMIELRRDPIRVWVPACSTGEEAYTIAMLLREALDANGLNTKVQVFGTDINEASIEIARAGFYSAAAVDNVPEPHVAKAFVPSGSGFVIRKDIRAMCVFARHNVMTHAPFLGMDLVSCRNMLIYLRKEAQEHVMDVLHYAVREGGHVLLGRAEAASTAQGFEHAGAPHLYRKLTSSPRARRNWPVDALLPWALPRDDAGPRAKVQTDQVDLAVKRCAMERYVPPGFVVNEAGDVVQFLGNVADFVAPATGEATLSLSRLLRADLNVPVRTALLEAKQSTQPVRRDRVTMEGKVYALEAVPFVVGSESRHFLLTLKEQPEAALPEAARLEGRGSREDDLEHSVVTLSAELDSAHAQLKTMVLEFESANEELRTSNEEMLSANEEMQSTNEELQSAKQELESTNQELHSLNEEMKDRNDQLAVANDDLSNLVEGIPLAVVLLDRHLRVRHATPQAAALFELPPDSVGKAMQTLTDRFANADIERMVDVAIKGLAASSGEYQDASGHWWLVNVRAYRTSDDRIDGAVLAFQDIDDLKQAVSQAELARGEAEQANAAKDAFLALVSHELRAPLNAISGWAAVLNHTLEGEVGADDTPRKAVATILRQCKAQAQLIDDLLDASRITSGRFAIDQHPVDLGDCVSAVLESMQPAARARELSLTGSGLRSGHTVNGDSRRLQQIVSNVLGNSIKFTPPGGRIEVVLTRFGGLLELAISDSGVGVSEDILPRLFDRFTQANMSRTREHGGLGLGLSIVKHLTLAHGGTVAALSDGLGKGMRIILRFPALEVHVGQPQAAAVPTPTEDALRLAILLVDDDADSREAIGELLRLVGAKVETAASVAEALALLDARDFDAIISDLSMPGRDGFELMRAVRSREMRDGRSRRYAVALSGLTSLQDRDMALAAGFDDHASKPVDANALVEWLTVAKERTQRDHRGDTA